MKLAPLITTHFNPHWLKRNIVKTLGPFCNRIIDTLWNGLSSSLIVRNPRRTIISTTSSQKIETVASQKLGDAKKQVAFRRKGKEVLVFKKKNHKTFIAVINMHDVLGKGHSAKVLKSYDPITHKAGALKIIRSNKNLYRQDPIKAQKLQAILKNNIIREGKFLKKVHKESGKELTGIQLPPYAVVDVESIQKWKILGFTRLCQRKFIGYFGPQYDGTAKTLINRSKQEKLNCVHQLLKGLAHLHSKGIVHGDIKPDNILVMNESGRCDLSDFEGALETASDFTDSSLLYTPNYKLAQDLKLQKELRSILQKLQTDLLVAKSDGSGPKAFAYHKKLPTTPLHLAYGSAEEGLKNLAPKCFEALEKEQTQRAAEFFEIAKQSDLLSLGLSLYRIFMGKHPFPFDKKSHPLIPEKLLDRTSPERIQFDKMLISKGYSLQLAHLLAGMLAKKAKSRITAEKALSQFETLLSSNQCLNMRKKS